MDKNKIKTVIRRNYLYGPVRLTWLPLYHMGDSVTASIKKTRRVDIGEHDNEEIPYRQ